MDDVILFLGAGLGALIIKKIIKKDSRENMKDIRENKKVINKNRSPKKLKRENKYFNNIKEDFKDIKVNEPTLTENQNNNLQDEQIIYDELEEPNILTDRISFNTLSQPLRNSNLQLRSEPPNPQVLVTPFYQTTMEPDMNRRVNDLN